MSLAKGTRIGSYEITGPLGSGGMGEVYQAIDTRLNRLVAIKTSKTPFDERFAREARTIAALNHPNIATLYDVGPDFLVMEFVEGEPVKGPLAHDEAVKVAGQIVDAIEAAHDKGIIHRDLKPGNILRREDGSIKVLDFGLAKALADDPTSSPAPGADSPTLTMEATQMGMILGTAAYMSPEQAKGKRADRRADIFSFGVVLYELLTGLPLFAGESTSEILAAVIKEEAKLDAVPMAWRGLLHRCLEKDPRQRLQAIGEARLMLEKGLSVEETLADVEAVSSRNGAWTKWLGWAVATLAVMAVAWLYLRMPAAEPKHLIRLEVSAPGPSQFPQISPDGQTIIFVSGPRFHQGLWKRDIGAADPEVISGTEGATYPFWSPDSKNIGFFQQGALKRMAISGGPAVAICPAVDGRGGTWNEAGVIVFAPGPFTGLFHVPAHGGTPELVIRAAQTDVGENIRFPAFLPDGQHFIYEHATQRAETSGVYLGSLKGEAPVRLRSDLTNAIYAAGFLLFRVQQTLMAQQFNLDSLRLFGEMTPVAGDVGEGGGNPGFGAFSVSANGTLVYRGNVAPATQLTWFDRSGKSGETIGDPGRIGPLQLSPDGKQVALEREAGGRFAVFLQPVLGGPASQIAGEARGTQSPVWSPEGMRIAFSKGGPRYDLFLKHLDGSAEEEPLNVSGLNAFSTDWSREWIVFQQDSEQTGKDIFLLPASGGKPVAFLQTPSREEDGRISPDGRWMTYSQGTAGRSEVFVQAVSPEGAATGIPYRISSSGGRFPHWRRDGKELFYLDFEGVVAVPVTHGTVFQQGPAQTLFKLPQGAQPGDISADGQHFLFRVPVGADSPSNSLTVVLNWTQALKR